MKRLINIEEIKEMTKGMPVGKKLQYIWQYYWIPICAVVLAVFMAFYLGYHAFFTVKDYWLFLLITNTRENVGNDSELWGEYVSYTGYDLKEKKVEFNNNSFFDASTKGGTNNNYYQAFAAYVESKTLDAVIGSRDSMVKIGESGRFLDLDDEKCQNIKEKYEERFIYCVPADEDYEKDLVPIAIDLTDSRLMTEYHVYGEGESCVLAIGAYAQHPDAVEQFLDMILEE